MKKLFMILGVLCILLYSATASSMFFTLYDTSIFTAPLIFSLEEHEAVKPLTIFPSLYSDITKNPVPKEIVVDNVKKESKREPLTIISITDDGFNPQKIIVKKDQDVIWINEREKLSALVVGLREISSMNSGFLNNSDTFTWTFSEPGEYTYVDAVLIGTVGKVVVQ